jgi:hypothetical protein
MGVVGGYARLVGVFPVNFAVCSTFEDLVRLRRSVHVPVMCGMVEIDGAGVMFLKDGL